MTEGTETKLQPDIKFIKWNVPHFFHYYYFTGPNNRLTSITFRISHLDPGVNLKLCCVLLL